MTLLLDSVWQEIDNKNENNNLTPRYKFKYALNKLKDYNLYEPSKEIR